MLIPLSGGRMTRRFSQLMIGLVLFGFAIGLIVQSGLGLPPWDVLHQGLEVQFGLSIGLWAVIVSVVVLLFWIPLRERPGIGTLLNAVVVGLVIDLTVWIVPEANGSAAAWAMLVGGIGLNGLASGMYIGARLGPGPRDGLMTGLAKRGISIRRARVFVEIVVLATGWAMGGTVWLGTLLFALAIGPLVQFFLPRWTVAPKDVPA